MFDCFHAIQIVVINDGSIDLSDIPSDTSDEEEGEEEDSDGLKRSRSEHQALLERNDAKRRKVTEYNAFNFYARPASIIVGSGISVDRSSTV